MRLLSYHSRLSYLFPLLIIPVDFFSTQLLIPLYRAGIGAQPIIPNLPEEFWRYVMLRAWFASLAAFATGAMLGWILWKLKGSRNPLSLYGIPVLYFLNQISIEVRDYFSHYATYYDVLVGGMQGLITLLVLYLTIRILNSTQS